MRRLAGPLLALTALVLASCAGAPPTAPPPREGAVVPPVQGAATDEAERGPFPALVARFSDQAGRQERAGDLARALESWKIVAALRPQEAEPKRRVADLSARVAAEGERHYRDGLTRLQEGDIDAARRELLLALATDPDHAGALDVLKNRLDPEAVPHTVAAGESFESIAKKQYGDPAKAALVARANGLDPGGRPAAGTVLSLPDLTPPDKLASRRRATPTVDSLEGYDDSDSAGSEDDLPAAGASKAVDPAETQLVKATELFKAGKFEAAAVAAEKLADNAVVGRRARELAGNAWFAVGEAALKADKFSEAEAAYRKAEPVRKDSAAAIKAAGRRKHEKAEDFYKAGVSAYINEKLDEAIRNWEQTIALNPEHPKAPGNIEKARALQQKLKDLR